jgi:hypothetical protein
MADRDLQTPNPAIILPNDTEADTNTHTLHSQTPIAHDVGFQNPKLDPPPVTSLEDAT